MKTYLFVLFEVCKSLGDSIQAFFTVQKMKFSIKDFFSKYDQILNRKLHYLCNVSVFHKAIIFRDT